MFSIFKSRVSVWLRRSCSKTLSASSNTLFHSKCQTMSDVEHFPNKRLIVCCDGMLSHNILDSSGI